MTAISHLARRLQRARHVLVLTGAGISAESGIPTFRDAQTGLWARYRPEDLATPEAFARDPALVWRWYAWRREKVAAAEPNAGHHAVAALARHVRTTLVTQNVDDLHQRAGSVDAIALHGQIAQTLCSVTRQAIAPAWLAANPGEPPASPHHPKGLARPGVVWFGENLPEDALIAAQDAAAECDVVLAIGTSGVVYPAASLPALAKSHGAYFAEINPQRTPLSPSADIVISDSAASALPAVLAAMTAG
ncbi:SIR2 family NAD-dependent protein deacylase [Tahibacter amnicola]|uniref:NAD-dependent protein deacylase n=1 Tax=Tahibacter amnicola TaxID=2976241 RepID=A0ABY6BIW2_9GAMM|nr:NAD-dependent deacylase [Tahibacter amnicola]UXI69809.1 NAD-dependent deacylase [Tahibacter amnicola]